MANDQTVSIFNALIIVATKGIWFLSLPMKRALSITIKMNIQFQHKIFWTTINPLQTIYLQPLEKLMEICIPYRKYLWQRSAHAPETRLLFSLQCAAFGTPLIVQETPTGWRWKTKSKVFVLPLEQDGEISGPAYIPVTPMRNFFGFPARLVPRVSARLHSGGFSDMQSMKFPQTAIAPSLKLPEVKYPQPSEHIALNQEQKPCAFRCNNNQSVENRVCLIISHTLYSTCNCRYCKHANFTQTVLVIHCIMCVHVIHSLLQQKIQVLLHVLFLKQFSLLTPTT